MITTRNMSLREILAIKNDLPTSDSLNVIVFTYNEQQNFISFSSQKVEMA